VEAKQFITNSLLRAIRKLTREPIDIQISVSERSENGDYYTNAALRLAVLAQGKLGKPLDIAYEIKGQLERSIKSTKSIKGDLGSAVDRIEVANPGFVNFFLSEQYLRGTLEYIKRKGDKFGYSDGLSGQKVMVEYTDPNPFKEFHIGHLYSNLVGESLSRLFESQGAQVWRVCYQGDVGLHVAKAIYGMMKLKDQMPDESALMAVRAQFMGRAYALGSQDYESNKDVKTQIDQLNKKIYEDDSSIRPLYKKGREWSLEYFESIYKRLGTKFDRFYFESEVGKTGADLVREFLKKKVFEKSHGAIIFPGKKQGLHNRVFINSLGIPTYEAKDLGLAPAKYKDFSYDRSIIITAQEQAEYFKVVLVALEQINPDLAKKTTHISHGMVKLPGGKISSRTGEVITGEWLIDEAVSRIRRAYPEMDDEISEKVGLAAIKFALLRGTIGRDIEFNFEESISLNGASGPYLLYTYVRTQSILEKSQKSKVKSQKSNTLSEEEKAVLRSLVHFPEIVSEGQRRMAPNLVAEYLFDLSQKFNLFYQKQRITGNKFRLELTASVGQVLKNGLNLLGIETVSRM
jgi:arginyl-tRNA synthetase